MNRTFALLATALICLSACSEKAEWISSRDNKNQPNTWIAFRKDLDLNRVPQSAVARIAADSKYWLMIDGVTVVREGGLKRGPNPDDTYCDEVDLAPYLHEGRNSISVLLWYFGKDGFAHNSSGRAGLFLDCPKAGLRSGADWLARIHPAFQNTVDPNPNYRLAESNVRFNATKDIPGWETMDKEGLDTLGFLPVITDGLEGDYPWGKLVKRPIPQWKDFGVKEVAFERRGDTAVARLPYDMQFTPVVTLDAHQAARRVRLQSDHAFTGAGEDIVHCLRAEYVTVEGLQTYESPGWINGDLLYVIAPETIDIVSVGYRESGYDTEAEGTFHCGNEFYNRFWQKALRTVYVNMRDNFFDCPDRERAQWWGDVVLTSGELFYSYSTSSHLLVKKAISELCAFQREDGTLHSPVPGSYQHELPGQMLASVGKYGIWNYYMNTGDIETLRGAYPAVKRYLALWECDETGLTVFRKGGWTWGDWGSHKDTRLIYAAMHYMALDGAALMAEELGLADDAAAFRADMEKVRSGYNSCWNGTEYRSPEYEDLTDDRVQALAVVAGIAPEGYWPAITKFLKSTMFASPYMEKYVMEALFIMGEGSYALDREQMRYAPMVNDTQHTTLFELWEDAGKGSNGGVNHAWSGGPLMILAQYLCGLRPLTPGWRSFEVRPDLCGWDDVAISFPTVSGTVAFEAADGSWTVTVPDSCEATVHMPSGEVRTLAAGKTVIEVD